MDSASWVPPLACQGLLLLPAALSYILNSPYSGLQSPPQPLACSCLPAPDRCGSHHSPLPPSPVHTCLQAAAPPRLRAQLPPS